MVNKKFLKTKYVIIKIILIVGLENKIEKKYSRTWGKNK